MASQHIVVVTIHGVGFQQPPVNGITGYADALHNQLRANLNKKSAPPLLSDDPIRRENSNEFGPVYVQSTWPPADENGQEGSREAGLQRLGVWDDVQPRRVHTEGWPLADDGIPIPMSPSSIHILKTKEPGLARSSR